LRIKGVELVFEGGFISFGAVKSWINFWVSELDSLDFSSFPVIKNQNVLPFFSSEIRPHCPRQSLKFFVQIKHSKEKQEIERKNQEKKKNK